MSTTISRRAFAAGGIATIAGAALFTLPVARVAAQATPAADLASLGLPTIDITITKDAFEGAPEKLDAGRYLLTITLADGVDFGSVGFISPPGSMSAQNFWNYLMAAIGTPEASPEAIPAASPAPEEGEAQPVVLPSIVYQAIWAGGASREASQTGPGAGQAVIDLPQGSWILWGNDPEAAQPPVFFSVSGAMPTDLTEPASDIDVTFADYSIAFDGALTAGDHLLRIENTGAEPHFLVLLKGPDQMTDDDLDKLFSSGMEAGTPPDLGWDPEKDITFILDTGIQSAGTVIWVPVTLETGTYAGLCFFPAAGTGVEHAFMGMHTVFKVT
jgi:hypothetical protein